MNGTLHGTKQSNDIEIPKHKRLILSERLSLGDTKEKIDPE